MTDDLISVLRQHAEVTAQLQAAVRAGKPEELLVALVSQLQVLEERRNDLVHGRGSGALPMGLITAPAAVRETPKLREFVRQSLRRK